MMYRILEHTTTREKSGCNCTVVREIAKGTDYDKMLKRLDRLVRSNALDNRYFKLI